METGKGLLAEWQHGIVAASGGGLTEGLDSLVGGVNDTVNGLLGQ